MCEFAVPPPAEPDWQEYCIPYELLAKYVARWEIRKIAQAQKQQTVAQEAAGSAGGASPKKKRKKPPAKSMQKRTQRAKKRAKGRKQKKQTAKVAKPTARAVSSSSSGSGSDHSADSNYEQDTEQESDDSQVGGQGGTTPPVFSDDDFGVEVRGFCPIDDGPPGYAVPPNRWLAPEQNVWVLINDSYPGYRLADGWHLGYLGTCCFAYTIWFNYFDHCFTSVRLEDLHRIRLPGGHLSKVRIMGSLGPPASGLFADPLPGRGSAFSPPHLHYSNYHSRVRPPPYGRDLTEEQRFWDSAYGIRRSSTTHDSAVTVIPFRSLSDACPGDVPASPTDKDEGTSSGMDI